MTRALDLADVADQLAGWLADRLAAEALRIDELEIPGHGGMSHDTVLFRARWTEAGHPREDRLVLRIEPTGPLIFPSYDLAFQAEVMRLLGAGTRIPVPEVLWFEERAAIFGRPFYVMRAVPGLIPSDNPPFLMGGPLFDASAEEQARAQRSVVETLAQLHRVDWRAVGLGFAERRRFGDSPLDQEFGYWRHYLDWASEAQPLPLLEAAFRWCVEQRPAVEGPPVFNWGDARYGNVVFAPDFGVRAILDWEMAVLGPGELDLGWFIFIHETALMWLADLPGFVDRDSVIEIYERARGRAVDDLHFYEAWAGFKAAAIHARMIQRDFAAGRCKDLRSMERNPITKSLRRLVDLPAV